MICTDDIQDEIAKIIGVQRDKSITPTWSDNLYACRYVYPNGELLLTVKDLKSTPDATAYYDSLRASLTSSTTLSGLGQGAFVAPDGSIFLRKDFNVLKVDVSGLPERFGEPALDRADLAEKVAAAIMKCWLEHH